MKKRPDGITVMSVYYWVIAALFALGACVLLTVLLATTLTGELYDTVAIFVLGLLVIVLFVIVAANVAAGLGLFRMQEWGRWLGIALGVLSLPAFPVGTIVGGLIIWYLLLPETQEAFLAPPTSEED
jgi:hypothetical protein